MSGWDKQEYTTCLGEEQEVGRTVAAVCTLKWPDRFGLGAQGALIALSMAEKMFQAADRVNASANNVTGPRIKQPAVPAPKVESNRVIEGGSGQKVHSLYADGTPVLRGQEPKRLPLGPDPAAGDAAHSRLRIDTMNNRVYQAREFGEGGVPVRDIDFTSPTNQFGRIWEGHLPPPHQHSTFTDYAKRQYPSSRVHSWRSGGL